MKKKTKLILGGISLALGTILLSGCTKSFCSVKDKAHILYSLDYGVTSYYDDASAPEGAKTLSIDGYSISGIKYVSNYVDAYYISQIDEQAATSNIATPSLIYWEQVDKKVLKDALDQDSSYLTKTEWTVGDIRADFSRGGSIEYTPGVLDNYGYLKFFGSSTNAKGKVVDTLWVNFEEIDNYIRTDLVTEGVLTIDDCPSEDYLSFYKTKMNSYISAYRSCLTTVSGNYGAYGQHKVSTFIEAKSWKDTIKDQGLFEFLLVWPIGAFIDVLGNGLLSSGVANGWAQLLAILIVTVIIRGGMLVLTGKQTQSTAKMSALQPEITKIQNKYPNAQTNQYDKQRMAQELQAIYKKNKINPLSSILVLALQFPIFICVWAALQGSALLSTGSVLGLNLSTSIKDALLSKAGWASFTSGAPAALILFILMAGSQALSMLLPQIFQKAKAKRVATTGRNPSQKQQNNKMQYFTYIMMFMIIFMGFSLVSGLGVYWFVGALFSIVQTLFTELFNGGKAVKKLHPVGFDAFLSIFGKKWWFKTKGTATREEFWSAIGILAGFSLIPVLGWILAIIAIPGVIGLIVRRLHDTNKSGYWAFFILFPIPLIVFLAKPGDENSKYLKENY